jgi:hypothetical protein
MSITGDLRALAQAGVDLLLARTRGLTTAEVREAKSVFLDTINYDDVIIADQLGHNGRPFTFWAGALSITQIAFSNKYVLFLGPVAFSADASNDWATFIHEMTHVAGSKSYYQRLLHD